MGTLATFLKSSEREICLMYLITIATLVVKVNQQLRLKTIEDRRKKEIEDAVQKKQYERKVEKQT